MVNIDNIKYSLSSINIDFNGGKFPTHVNGLQRTHQVDAGIVQIPCERFRLTIAASERAHDKLYSNWSNQYQHMFQYTQSVKRF